MTNLENTFFVVVVLFWKMVFCGKPSKGCLTCRERKIGVSRGLMFLYSSCRHDQHSALHQAYHHVEDRLLTSHSVTRRLMVVPSVSKSTGSVPDIETNWT